ncbi:uncharacterized protein LOC143137605 [Alosa pseudoharengus]|uniref:uncharacterized protein LOC143137605 n=1 Tax=Alosa pseudoharengus TaxID=34774 RepID=UPI003F88A166
MAKMDQSTALKSFIGMTKPAMVEVGNSYKCSLCKKAGDYASLVPHIQTHSRNVLTYKGIQIYRCGLDCCDVPHYHCCFCNQSVVLKNVFIRHLKRCDECLTHKANLKQACSGDQNSDRTTASSRPSANAPSVGIVVQTSAGPALLRTTPVQLQGTAGHLLLLQTTATASSPKQASTVKSSPQETTTTVTTTSTSNKALTTKSSQDDEPTTTSFPSQAPELQTPTTAAMELAPDPMETLPNTTATATSPSLPQTTASSPSPRQPTTAPSWQQTSVTSSSADQAPTGTPSEEQESSSANPVSPSHSPPPSASEMAEMSSQSESKEQRRRMKCPHCPMVLFKRNLKVHITRHHKDLPVPARESPKRTPQLKSVWVDRKNGIVAVRRHARGFLAPVHAQRKVYDGQVVRCDLKECHQFQQMAKRHGLSVSHCQHTKDLDLCNETAPYVVLDQEVLDEMVVVKQLSDAKRAVCLRRQKMAKAAKIPFSVRVDLGGAPRRVFVSVHESKTNEFSCLGRVMVSYNVDRNEWLCPCTKPHISCVHKNIAKWHVFQTNRDLIKGASLPSRNATGRGNVDSTNDTNSANGDVKRSVEYIYEHKRIPAELPEDLTNTVFEFPAHLFPVETTCDLCLHEPSLEESEIVTDQAKIVTMMGVANHISTYIRRCPDCQVLYRYQEWQDGLHNFDNHLILSIELCLYLRHSLQNQIPVSRAVQTLESLRNARFPSAEDLLNAYSHFEAMNGIENTDSAIDDNDCRPALVADLHRKAFLTLHWR